MSTPITVEGTSCGHCEETVAAALDAVDGVVGVTADRETARATVRRDADAAALVRAVEDAGYAAHA